MIWMWVGFISLVLALLALDLGVFNRGSHEMSVRRALKFVLLFVVLGAVFNVGVYFMYARDWMGMGTEFARLSASEAHPHEHAVPERIGPSGAAPLTAQTLANETKNTVGVGVSSAKVAMTPHEIGTSAAMQFLAGWLTEYSLSIDNLFVIALIFAFFKVPKASQHRVLFWGILGALVARAAMILIGTAAIQRFEWLLYILGVFLIFTGIKMALSDENKDHDFNRAWIVRLARMIVPISPEYDGAKFFTRLSTGARAATPLFLALLIIEATDVVFAVDSIPAIIGITRDPFIVFTSNVFAIMGLRSLYFALAATMDKFHYLKYSLAFILAFVGVKMLLEGVHHVPELAAKVNSGVVPGYLSWVSEKPVHVPTAVALGVIAASLLAGVGASMVFEKRHGHTTPT